MFSKMRSVGVLFFFFLLCVLLNRFEGVIPKDDDSRKLLADDAYDLAISWGKPAGRIAFVAVDLFIFLFFFRYNPILLIHLDYSRILENTLIAHERCRRHPSINT